MFDSADNFGNGRARSLLSVAPSAAAGETGATGLDDAALRHKLARTRRERRANPLLAVPIADENAKDHPPEPVEEPEAEARDPADAGGPGWIEALAARLSRPRETAPAAEEPSPARPQRFRPRAIAGLTLAGAGLGAALAAAWPATYVATSEVLIDPRAARAADAAPLSPDAAFALVDNQLRVLRSGTMLNAAAERLNLAADAEFNGTAPGLFGLGAWASGLGDLLTGDGASAVDLRRRQVVDGLAGAVAVERVAGSSVVQIAASTADPQKSALIANTIAELFVGGTDGVAAEAGQANPRLAELRAALDEAERAVERFKAENDLVDAQGRLITDDEILRVGEQLATARARTGELNARAASARDADTDSIVTGSLPEQFASPTVAALRARHAELKQQLDRLSVKLGPRHPERLAAQAELDGAREEIRGELRRVAAALQTELRRAVQQEQSLAAELARMKARQAGIGDELIGLRQLEREAEARRAAYEGALHAARSGGAVSAIGAASLISRAEPPLRAAGPSLAGFSLAGALAGLGAGMAAGARQGRRRNREDFRERVPDTVDDAAFDDAFAGDDLFNGKDAEDMHSYHTYPQPDPAAQPQVQPPAAMHAPHPQAAPVYYPPMQHYPQPPAYAPAYAPPPWAAQPPYPYPPHPAGWHPAPAHGAMPHYDPWAHQRGYAPPPPAHPQPQQPTHTVVYVPVPQTPAAPAASAAEPPRQEERRTMRASLRARAANEDGYEPEFDADERTSAAIEEIRNSLRQFREAVEDFAQDRRSHRRFGT